MTSIDVLPDDILLSIFDFCVDKQDKDQESNQRPSKKVIEVWQSLVHVCRRWRRVVFGSPRRLNLRLLCTDKTPVRDILNVWPPLPLVILNHLTEGADNLVAVLERKDRVERIELTHSDGEPSERVLAAMQEPFPELTHLNMWLRGEIRETVPVLPDSFLGGSAPHLQFLGLNRITFTGLPKLLLSTTHLVTLHLSGIPHSGYLSPEAMASTLSMLTSLKDLWLTFDSPRSHPHPESRRPPPPTRSVLPALTRLLFRGACEYLDDFVARIDAPRLNDLPMTFFKDIVFDAPHLAQFINRAPMLKSLEITRVVFRSNSAIVKFSSQTSGYGSLNVEFSCRELNWIVSSVVQACTSCSPLLSTTEDLYIYQNILNKYYILVWQDDIELLELLRPFIAAKNLYLCKEMAPLIVPALQELVGGRTTEVLPTLQNIFLEVRPSGPVQEVIQKFVAARELSGHPITVSQWKRDSYEDWF